MNVGIDPGLLAGFLLALVRTSAWVAVTPPFSNGAIPGRVKVLLAAGLSVSVAPQLDYDPSIYEIPNFLAAVAYQTITGLALGFVVYLVFAVVQAAGELIDLQAGFSAAQLYDPFTQAAATPIGRLYQLVALAILFAINGHLLLVRGFLRSFEAAPLGGVDFDRMSVVVTSNLGNFLVSAMEIAAPLLAALFLAEIVLGMLTKAAPQVNILQIGFIAKILMALLMVGLAMPLLPEVIRSLTDRSIRLGDAIVGG